MASHLIRSLASGVSLLERRMAFQGMHNSIIANANTPLDIGPPI